MNKDIILIGGTAGVGKTTLAKKLCSRLSFDHRLGTGFIREILRSQTKNKKNNSLFRYTFATDDPIKNFREQCTALYPAIIACIKRAKLEGTSLVIEGNHLLPSLYKSHVAKFIIITAPDNDTHRLRITGKTHVNRKISDADFIKVKKIETDILAEAKKNNVLVVEYSDNINSIIDKIQNGC